VLNHPAEQWWAELDESDKYEALIAASPNGVIPPETWRKLVHPARRRRSVRRKVGIGEHELTDPRLDFLRTILSDRS